MANPTINDRLRVIHACGLDNQLGLNIRYYRVSLVNGVGATENVIANRLFLIFQPLYSAVMSASADYLGISVRNVTPVPLQAAQSSDIDPESGDVAGDPLPPQTSGIITFRTTLAGRRYRGRAYPPFPAEASNGTDHIPTPAYMTDLLALANALVDIQDVTIAGDGYELTPVIYRPSDLSSTDLTAAVPRRAWATQRRRGAYGQSNPQMIPL